MKKRTAEWKKAHGKEEQRINPGSSPSSGGGQSLEEAMPKENERSQKSAVEELRAELANLEDQFEGRKNLEQRRINSLGQKLFSYNEGFTWCPKCHYVSNKGETSELKREKGLQDAKEDAAKVVTNGRIKFIRRG